MVAGKKTVKAGAPTVGGGALPPSRPLAKGAGAGAGATPINKTAHTGTTDAPVAVPKAKAKASKKK